MESDDNRWTENTLSEEEYERVRRGSSDSDNRTDDLEGCLVTGCLFMAAPLTAGVAGLSYGIYEAVKYFIN